MKNSYFDLVEQTFYFPQDGFTLDNNRLIFNGIPLYSIIKKHGTPLKLTFLPVIGEKIKQARNWFRLAMKKHGYRGKYVYCYCTKSSHFKFVVDEVLDHDAQLETSSAFDIQLVRQLHKAGRIKKSHTIIHNGFKPDDYARGIADLINDD